MYEDCTIEIYNMILEEYKMLDKDGILVIDYTGSARNHQLYHVLEWYISYESYTGHLHFDNRHFNYSKLIEMLNNSKIDYISKHISIEEINERFKNSVSLISSMRRDFETVSKLYVADQVDEKIKGRKLIYK